LVQIAHLSTRDSMLDITFPGYFLYYPSRHQPAALAALIRALRL